MSEPEPVPRVPEITLPLLWQAIQDLKKDPVHQNKPLAHLTTEAIKQLELCYYYLHRPPHLTERQFAAFQVNDRIYAMLSNPLRDAYLNRDLLPIDRAAILITRNQRKSEALQRFHEFVLNLPSLDSQLFRSGVPEPEKLWQMWTEHGIPRPLTRVLKPEFEEYWKGIVSLSAQERGRKAQRPKNNS
jgi:hypothetical protein